MKFKLKQDGDTLIEVIMATVIIGAVLFSAYTLTNKAFQLSQSARERTQAAQLLQQQAEGLRSLRDTADNWGEFVDQFDSVNLQEFHMVREVGGDGKERWRAVSNGAENWQPGCETGSCGPGQDDKIATFYRLNIQAELVENPASPAENDKLSASITITWPRFGGGQDETSTLHLHLVDRQLPLLSVADAARNVI